MQAEVIVIIFLCAKNIAMQVIQMQRASHMDSLNFNSCLVFCQYFPLSSFPGFPALLSPPQVGGLLLKEYHHWQVTPAIPCPELGLAGHLWLAGACK